VPHSGQRPTLLERAGANITSACSTCQCREGAGATGRHAVVASRLGGAGASPGLWLFFPLRSPSTLCSQRF